MASVPVTHLEFLVEEPSMEAALLALVPSICPELTFDIHVYKGKDVLLARLPSVLCGYRSWLPADHRIVVVVDRDRDDCLVLKRTIEKMVRKAGLVAKGAQPDYQVITRIAVEELEAWFLGDVDAIAAAYPRVPKSLGSRRGFRQVDQIAGGTWEALQRVLQAEGYFPQGLPKIQVAREISAHMDPTRNRSPSFRAFRQGLLEL